MRIPNKLNYFVVSRDVGALPLLRFSKLYTCMSGRFPFLHSQMNLYGDCFFSTEMSKNDTLEFLRKHNIKFYQVEFFDYKPTIIDIYYDRTNRY
jgi:hypothetical protein